MYFPPLATGRLRAPVNSASVHVIAINKGSVQREQVKKQVTVSFLLTSELIKGAVWFQVKLLSVFIEGLRTHCSRLSDDHFCHFEHHFMRVVTSTYLKHKEESYCNVILMNLILMPSIFL